MIGQALDIVLDGSQIHIDGRFDSDRYFIVFIAIFFLRINSSLLIKNVFMQWNGNSRR